MAIDAAAFASARINRPTQKAAPVNLRPSSAADHADLFAVFASTRADEFMHLDWEPDRIVALLADQCRLQDTYYHRRYPQAHFDVVLCDDKMVGRLYHNWSETELRIIDIALLPDWRGQGIGTRLMHALVSVASQHGKSASLYVEVDNPVCALYERLGFKVVGEEGAYQLMQRPADAPALAGLPQDESLNELFQQEGVCGL